MPLTLIAVMFSGPLRTGLGKKKRIYGIYKAICRMVDAWGFAIFSGYKK